MSTSRSCSAGVLNDASRVQHQLSIEIVRCKIHAWQRTSRHLHPQRLLDGLCHLIGTMNGLFLQCVNLSHMNAHRVKYWTKQACYRQSKKNRDRPTLEDSSDTKCFR